MANAVNRKFLLAARPNGMATLSDFKLVQEDSPSTQNGEVLFRNILFSVDPYQRNLMGNGSSELPPINVGEPMQGPTVAVVEESKHRDFAVGDHVQT